MLKCNMMASMYEEQYLVLFEYLILLINKVGARKTNYGRIPHTYIFRIKLLFVKHEYRIILYLFSRSLNVTKCKFYKNLSPSIVIYHIYS